jgi:hypothetical protein
LPVINETKFTPCEACDKIPEQIILPDGTTLDKRPTNRKLLRQFACELSSRTWQAYQHYRRCRAVNQFPDDELVHENALYFQEGTELAAREERYSETKAILSEIANSHDSM